MNSITEKDVLDHVQSKFNPDVILLGGSRAQGSSRLNSDWDLYLVGDYPDNIRYTQLYKGHDLDIAVYPTDALKNGILRIYYGPVSELKVLKDNIQGDGARIKEATRNAYEAGPGELSPDEREALAYELSRLLDKTEPVLEDALAATFRLAEFYREVIPAWFRMRSIWSLPISQALDGIRSEDSLFAKLLEDWVSTGDTRRQLAIGRDLVSALTTSTRRG